MIHVYCIKAIEIMNSVKPTLIVSNIELNLIPMLQLKLCCLSHDWPWSLHSSAEAIRETSFSFFSIISFSILISVSHWIFDYSCMIKENVIDYKDGIVFSDSWKQTKTDHQGKFYSMSCEGNSPPLGWQVFTKQWLPYATPNISVKAILERQL